MIGELALGLAAGVVVGAFFFGGLAWTVGRLGRSPGPVRLLVASFVVRIVASAAALAVLAAVGRLALAAGLLSLVATRFVIIRMTRSRGWTDRRESTMEGG